MVYVMLKGWEKAATGKDGLGTMRLYAETMSEWKKLIAEGRLPHEPKWCPEIQMHRVQIDGYLLGPFTFDISKIPPERVADVTCSETRANFFHRDGLYEIKARDVGIVSDDVCKIHVVSEADHGVLVQRIQMRSPTVALFLAAYKAFFEGYYSTGSQVAQPVKPVSDWSHDTMVVTRGEAPASR